MFVPKILVLVTEDDTNDLLDSFVLLVSMKYLFCNLLLQIYDFDRDYKDVGVAKFTTKYFVVRNCLPKAKCDMLLSAWNPPSEWGKYEFFLH